MGRINRISKGRFTMKGMKVRQRVYYRDTKNSLFSPQSAPRTQRTAVFTMKCMKEMKIIH